LAAVESITVSKLGITTTDSQANGSFITNAAIFAEGSQSAFNHSPISITYSLSGPFTTKSASNYPFPGLVSLPDTLESFDFVQLQTDLKITSLAAGASITVSDPFGVQAASSVPEPSSLVLFAIPSTIMLAALARRRWYSRRRNGSDQRAAASLCG
jgi:hypothetical protein